MEYPLLSFTVCMNGVGMDISFIFKHNEDANMFLHFGPVLFVKYGPVLGSKRWE
jgi:hypothetical protein